MFEKIIASIIGATTLSMTIPVISEVFADSQIVTAKLGLHDFTKTGYQTSFTKNPVLCPISKSKNICEINKWSQGFLLFNDSNHNNLRDDDEEILKLARLDYPELKIYSETQVIKFSDHKSSIFYVCLKKQRV